jgi:sortase (surface protein transpeptidase)
MREVRKENTSGANTVFRQAVVEELERKATTHREKVNLAAEKKNKKEETLRATGVEQNRKTIARMTIPQLKAQFDIYKCIVKDALILKITLVSIPRCADKLQAVVAALDRYEA